MSKALCSNKFLHIFLLLKLDHFDIFVMLFLFLVFVKVFAHNFMNRSRDGVACKGKGPIETDMDKMPVSR